MLGAKRSDDVLFTDDESDYLSTDAELDDDSDGEIDAPTGQLKHFAMPTLPALQALNEQAKKAAADTQEKTTKPRQIKATLDSNGLLTDVDTGLPKLRSLPFPKRPPPTLSGTGEGGMNRAEVLACTGRILRLYREWAHGHYPKLTFDAFLERLEGKVSREPTMRAYLAALKATAPDQVSKFTEASFIADHLFADAMASPGVINREP